MNDWVLHDGTRQLDRIPRAASDYFQLDEMAFEQMLSMAVDYAKLLRFHNSNDLNDTPALSEQAYWEDIFLGDEVPVIAQVLTTDLAVFEADFRKFLLNFQRNHFTLPENFEPDQLPTYCLARKLDGWFDRLRVLKGEIPTNLSQQLAGLIIPDLMHELSALAVYLQHFDSSISERFRNDFRRFWFARPVRDENKQLVIRSGEDAERFLRGNFHAFYKAIALFQNTAAMSLSSSLQSQEHSPAVGLYMVFLNLYKQVQGTINQFTDRHLDFYYHDVLKFGERPAVSDSTYLLLAQDGSKRHVLVRKGTAFSAGIDEQNRDIIFTADSDVLISQTQVGALYTLYFERNRLISPERDFGFVTSGKVNKIPLTKENTAQDKHQAWPLFGAPKEETSGIKNIDAKLGFAISSPTLLLQEGLRDISINFNFEYHSGQGPHLTTTDNVFVEWLTQLAEFTETTKLDSFFKTFREMFRISVTTEEGWYEVKEYLPLGKVVEPDQTNHDLTIQIRLSPDVEPIIPYIKKIHGDGYDTNFPIVRFELNPICYIYPYSLLTKLIVRDIDIEVAVSGVKNILIYNQLGQLDANTPFNPFGPTPALGSYFLVGCTEAAQKQLTSLELDIEWGGLPNTANGFPEYYSAYASTFNNNSFEVSIAALKGGKWLPSASMEHPTVRLFTTLKSDNSGSVKQNISKSRTIPCQSVAALSQPNERVLNGEPFVYTPQAKDGFFKFTLRAPEQAFGHKDYPFLLTQILTENARLKKIKLARPIPQPPYTPLIESIELNYTARVSLNMDHASLAGSDNKHEKMFHIHPFGTEYVSPQTHRRIMFLPDYNAAGNLFIGLTGDDLNGPLSLLFHLREDSNPRKAVRPSTPVWSYLSENGWQKLEQFRIRADGTSGFLSSGVIEIELPDDISRGNNMMPSDLNWLMVAVHEHPEALCSAYGVFTQAVRVSRELRHNNQADSCKPLPAKRITSSLASIPGIVQINQPIPSFGGKPSETAQTSNMRIGERLRHKHRASVNWDYERLILERFPEIYMVKCFSNLIAHPEPDKRNSPGNLLIVVVPQLVNSTVKHLQPLADRLLLHDIKEFIQTVASPFARIEVRNPDYEQIQVRCTVNFSSRATGNNLISLNQAISDYLSPWKQTGYSTFFGWRIRSYDVESHIKSMDNVNHVTCFSMLRVANTAEDHYLLEDTVTKTGSLLREFGPTYPWSIAVPVHHHHIEVSDKPISAPPHRTGVSDLEIGATFILS